MSKGIELTQSQIKAYENGATKFIFPITESMQHGADTFENYVFIKRYSPIKQGDKDIFINEKTITCSNCNFEQSWIELEEIKSLQECPYCGYCNEVVADTFNECIDVKIVRVQDIEWVMGYHFQRFYNRCMEERNINRTYKDNDYVFSVEFKRCQD